MTRLPSSRVLAKAPAPPMRRRVRGAAVVELAEPPREGQPWPIDSVPAEIPTDFGVHIWSARSAQEVWARYAARGNPLLLDVEHNAGGSEDEPAPTAGYATLELREGVPWLLFDWSAYGVEQITTKQRRFLSAEYDIDPDTNEIVTLYRVSLVADPATHNARILASAKENRSMDIALILAALRAALAAEDPAVAKESIANLVDQLSAELGTDAPPADPPADPDPAFTSADGGDDKDDDKDKPAAAVAAKAPAAPAKASAPPAPAPAPTVVNVAASAPETESIRIMREERTRSENALRDMLIAQHGHRLAPSIRVWASAQPLAIVKGLLEAAPEGKPVPTRVTATRGADHGNATPERRGLEGPELEEYQKRLGTFQASAPKLPYTNEQGHRVFPTTTPREMQRILAARQQQQAQQQAKEGR